MAGVAGAVRGTGYGALGGAAAASVLALAAGVRGGNVLDYAVGGAILLGLMGFIFGMGARP